MEASIPDTLSALGHPNRLAIFSLLMRRHPDRVPAGELADALGLKPSTLSAYLSTLRQTGLIRQERMAPKLEQDNDFDTKNARMSTVARYAAGWADWRGVYGSPGA